METKNSTYLILSIVLLILSIFGGYFLFQNFKNTTKTSYNSTTVPKIELIPTDSPETEQITAIPTIESSSSAKITSLPATSSTTKISPTKIPTKIPTKTITPTKSATSSSTSLKDYSNSADGFSVSYSSFRAFTQDTETSGNRYTFSYFVSKNESYNFAIHVSPSGSWAWTHSNRQFSTGFTVSDQPTFRYDIATQTIVDLQSSDKNYTIQCVHNGKESLKAECEAFLASFKLL